MESNRIIRRAEVENIVGLSRSSIYAAMTRNEFPRPVRIGIRAVGWRRSDISEWLSSRAEARDGR